MTVNKTKLPRFRVLYTANFDKINHAMDAMRRSKNMLIDNHTQTGLFKSASFGRVCIKDDDQIHWVPLPKPSGEQKTNDAK